MKRSRIVLLVVLLVSMLVAGCDGQNTMLTPEENEQIAVFGIVTFLHTMFYVQNELVGDVDGLIVVPVVDGEDLKEIDVIWSDFDLGSALIALMDLDGYDENSSPESTGSTQIIANGTAHAIIATGQIDMDMKLTISDAVNDYVPHGTFTVVINITNFGVEDEEPTIVVKVNGFMVDISLD